MKGKSVGGYRPPDQRSGGGHRRSAPRRGHYERNRDRYRTVLENLSSIIVDPRGYLGSLKTYAREEYRRRVRLAVAGIAFLMGSLFLLFVFLSFAFLSGFLYLDRFIMNPALTSFLLALSALLLFFIFAYVALRQLRGVGEFRQRPPSAP